MASELKRKTTLSLGVSVGSAVATAAMQAAILVCLARLLTPADYGQVAAVLIIAQPIQQILLTGLERSMLLDDHLTSGESSACLALGAMLGVISAILVAVYGLAAGFALNRPSTMFVAFGLVPQLVIGATGCAPRAMLRRQMRFAKLAQSELTAQALGLGLCSIAVAWAGGGALQSGSRPLYSSVDSTRPKSACFWNPAIWTVAAVPHQKDHPARD
ncbi:MAG: oligosaccharide flippase family protein [Caulobacteraceae bacterium]